MGDILSNEEIDALLAIFNEDMNTYQTETNKNYAAVLLSKELKNIESKLAAHKNEVCTLVARRQSLQEAIALIPEQSEED